MYAWNAAAATGTRHNGAPPAQFGCLGRQRAVLLMQSCSVGDGINMLSLTNGCRFRCWPWCRCAADSARATSGNSPGAGGEAGTHGHGHRGASLSFILLRVTGGAAGPDQAQSGAAYRTRPVSPGLAGAAAETVRSTRQSGSGQRLPSVFPAAGIWSGARERQHAAHFR